MGLNPSYEDAYEIVKLYWEEGYSRKEAAYESGVYAKSTLDNRWRDLWERDENGELVRDGMKRAFQDFRERIPEFVKSRLPELTDRYLAIARNAGSDADRRRAIEFLLETVGNFSKKTKVEMDVKNEFQRMGPEEFVEYLSGMPGVEVNEEQFISGMFRQ